VIDLHSHLLPGVDDGARSLDQAVSVLHTMAGRGVTGVCLTPHLSAGDAVRGVPEAHDRAYERLMSRGTGLPALYRGAEVLLDRPLDGGVAARREITLAGSRYLLCEFGRLVTVETVSQAVGRIVELGLVPLVAHPERYGCCTPGAVTRWRAIGARFQVDATTLVSHSSRGTRARQLVAAGLADIIAGDNHGDERTMVTGADMLREHGGDLQADLLAVTNPRTILDDGDLDPVPPLALRESWLRRVRRLLQGDDR